MGYYLAGDYYRAGGGRNYAAGGLFSFLGRAARTVGGVMGGPAGALLTGAGGLLAPSPIASANPSFSVAPGAGTRMPTPTQAAHGVTGVGLSSMGTIGIKFKGTRRMNAGNAKAARRAIRRIKSVRHMLQSIERELPRRPAPKGASRGVITRAEAARALRA